MTQNTICDNLSDIYQWYDSGSNVASKGKQESRWSHSLGLPCDMHSG